MMISISIWQMRKENDVFTDVVFFLCAAAALRHGCVDFAYEAVDENA